MDAIRSKASYNAKKKKVMAFLPLFHQANAWILLNKPPRTSLIKLVKLKVVRKQVVLMHRNLDFDIEFGCRN